MHHTLKRIRATDATRALIALAVSILATISHPLLAADGDTRETSLLFCGNSYLGHYRVNNSLASEFALLTATRNSRLRLADWQSFRIGGSSIRQRWEMSSSERTEALKKHNQSDPARRELTGTLPEAVSSGAFQLIILQQHSKARGIESEARPVVEAARAAGSQVILFMTWKPRNGKPEAQERISQAYQQAGAALNVPVLPTGDLWTLIQERAPGISLYSDNGHPSAVAHHINALALYRLLTGSDLTELPSQASRFEGNDASDRERHVRAAIVEFIQPLTAQRRRR